MALQTRGAERSSFFSENLVKTALVGSIIGGVGYLLYRLGRPRGHTIPPIIIKSVDIGSDPIGIETEEPLEPARSLLQKIEYETDFDVTIGVLVELRNTPNQWVQYWFEDSSGLDVKIDLQQKDGNQWKDEPGFPHLTIAGKSERFRLTTEQLSGYMPGNSDRPYKRGYNGTVKRRIGKVEVVGFPPVSTSGYKYVEVWFYDEHDPH
ncbi:MAG TPA: hypothetical protein VFZ23_09115 [Pyrinomonadaceae bacterium]